MMNRFLCHCVLMFAAAFVFAGQVVAQDEVDIRFERGATGTTINGTIVGGEYIDYVLRADAGQTLIASLEVTGTNGNGSAFFNVLPAGRDFPALYNGSTDDDRTAEVTFPESGEWAIRVYLMGNDRDTGKTVGFSIEVRIPPSDERQDSGREQWVRVTGVAHDDTLKVRSGPGADFQVVGVLSDGDKARRIACEQVDSGRWCEIEMQSEMRERGWVNARFLAPDRDLAPASGSGGTRDEVACLQAVEDRAATSDLTVLSYTTSEANNLVMIRDQWNVTWRCLVDDGDVVELNPN